MMRVCHLNTCPVGIATQDPELRKKFEGKPEHVVNFMMFIAEELREYMAQLGFRTVDEMVGRVDVLDVRDAIEHWKARGVDLSAILHKPDVPPSVAMHCVAAQDHGLDKALDNVLIERAGRRSNDASRSKIDLPIRNVNRTVGTMLSAEVSRRHGEQGLPPDTITLRFTGSAGQSFGAWLASGVALELEGDANDYFGKGLSGGSWWSSTRRSRHLRGRRQHHHRQRRALRRDRRRGVPARHGGRALLRAQQRRDRGGRGRRAITAAST